MKKYLIFVLSCTLFISSSYATDHLDSPYEDDFLAADITDLFAFSKKDNGKNHLVLAMTVNVFAEDDARFSEKVEYSFYLRHLDLNGFGKDFSVNSRDEYRISCVFESNKQGGQNVRCSVEKTQFAQQLALVENTVGDLSGGSNDAIRIFAGHRADPFFFDAVRVSMSRLRTVSYNDIGFPFPGMIPKNGLASSNVLAIVVELDVDEVFGKGGNLFGVAAHTTMTQYNGTEKFVLNLDRVGRPEVTNFIMGQFSITDEKLNKVKKQWNVEASSFSFGTSKTDLYSKTIEDGLVNLDLKDTGFSSNGQDWPSPHPLVDTFMNDFLIVDVSKSADVNSETYFEIEMARYQNRPHETCGGRTPNDDFVDSMLTLLINGPDRKEPARGDGIDAQPRPATNEFPYLATPHK